VPGVHAEFLGPDGLPTSVEAAALHAYAHAPTLGGPGWTGLHAENAVATTLFGLLFWDILFAPHPHVFQTAYQGTHNMHAGRGG
jgi:fanconi-associated nuclease 1